jgi:hypothetical protein
VASHIECQQRIIYCLINAASKNERDKNAMFEVGGHSQSKVTKNDFEARNQCFRYSCYCEIWSMEHSSTAEGGTGELQISPVAGDSSESNPALERTPWAVCFCVVNFDIEYGQSALISISLSVNVRPLESIYLIYGILV